MTSKKNKARAAKEPARKPKKKTSVLITERVGYTIVVRTIGVPVTDQDRALHFYVDTLGFAKRIDVTLGTGLRWIEVAPDDVTVVVQGWDGSGYASQDAQRYLRRDGKWSKAGGVTSGASSETEQVA